MEITASDQGRIGLGGFLLEHMELALPLQSLREVLPCQKLSPLPCPNPAVIGGIDVRGVVIPVLDLRTVLGKAANELPHPCVIIMVHRGHVLGLICSGVSGVFEVPQDELHLIENTEKDSALFQGAVIRKDTSAMVGLISPDALFSLPMVPRTQDPEPQRSAPLDSNDTHSLDDEDRQPVMLMRCAGVAMCIDTAVVAATLMAPSIRPSALAMGHCKGVIEHAGMEVPAVDLKGFLGLGKGKEDELGQAFVMNTPQGAVALLISEVIDVVPTRKSAYLSVPPFASPHPRLFHFTLPSDALPSELMQRLHGSPTQYLLLDGEALRREDEIRSLASAVRQPGSDHALHGQATQAFVAGADDIANRHGGQPVLTFMVGGENAVPMGQVQEILPCPADISKYETNTALLGMMTNRGRSIPVLCLSELMGLPRPEITSLTSVLVVNASDVLLGFAVPTLKSIASAQGEKALQLGSGTQASGLQAALQRRRLIQMGAGQDKRLLPLLDLAAIAAAVTQEHLGCQLA